jgi:hypothetical protein
LSHAETSGVNAGCGGRTSDLRGGVREPLDSAAQSPNLQFAFFNLQFSIFNFRKAKILQIENCKMQIEI